MKSFPDFHDPHFNLAEYNKIFEKKNVIIHASAKNVSYAEHWGPLSIKCTIKGIENYQCGNRVYSVDNNCYLIFNDGQYYSSYIHSDEGTESFTVNFSTEFWQHALQGLADNFDASAENKNFEFIEKLYTYDNTGMLHLKNLYKASLVKNPDVQALTEMYYDLLENLLLQQATLKNEIRKIKAVKNSTQTELYKRLNYAKDFIYSCYKNQISLDELAAVACMSSAYFLREFKKYFGLSPYQYIMQRRLHMAAELLETTAHSIAEVCFIIGYSDVTSFIKLFKKYFSFTPAAYRLHKTKKSFFTC